jgi:hypothetical protein
MIMKKNVLSTLIFLLAFGSQKAQQFSWAKSMGSTGDDMGVDITTDTSGNVITIGHYSGTVDFDPSPNDTYTLTSAPGGRSFFISKLSPSGKHLWTRSIDGNSTQNNINSVTTDASGNVYITGRIGGVTDFDPSPNTTFTLSPKGSSGVFISKLDTAGNLVWAFSMGSISSGNYGNDIAVDAAGDLYVIGSFSGTMDFDPLPASTKTLSSINGSDVFICKYTSAGSLVWANRFGGGGGTWGKALAVDKAQNVYLTGWFNGTADLNPSPAVVNTYSSMGVQDMFVSKLDASGNFVWARQIGGALSERPNAIALDQQANIYLTGSFAGTTDFDPSPGTHTISSLAASNIFLCKLDSAGSFGWAFRVGSSTGDNDAGIGLAISNKSNVYVTGGFYGTVDFDPSPASTYTLKTLGGIDMFVAQYDSNGNFGWARQMSSPSYDLGQGVAVDADENVYTTGGFYGTVDYDPSPLTSYTLASAGLYDIFISKLSTGSGTPVTVGLSSYAQTPSLNIFPNPANEQLVIRKSQDETLSALIYNVTGQVVMSTELKESSTTLSLSGLSEGIYQVVILQEASPVYQTKLIKVNR